MNNMNLFNNKKYFMKEGMAQIISVILIFIVISTVILIIIMFFRVRSVYLNVLSGRQNLNITLTQASNGNFNKASESAKRAVNNFSSARKTLDNLQNNFFISKIKFISNNINDFKYLAQTAEILSNSAEKSLFIINDFENIVSGNKAKNFLEFEKEEKAQILKKLYHSYPEMQGIKANIDLSLIYLGQAKKNKILSTYFKQINSLEEQLINISSTLGSVVSLSTLIPVLTGYPDPVSYLILLQNNNELRPTGGFIGTYGVLEINLGDIVKLETHDTYHLDMPASLNKNFNITPPDPLKAYLGVDKWFMRDGNWSPDWPISAKKIQWFYEEEMKAANRGSEVMDFSGVIAITPEIITDLLYIVGPIEIDGKTYDKDNFIDVLQYEVEMAFREEGISEWDRKLVIGEILKELKIKLFNLPSNRWMELADIFKKNISEKNILVYLNNEYDQKISADLNWGGEIKDSLCDYLMVIDANLAAYKTDRVMDKRIKYFLNEEPNGKFKARVEIIYKNNGWFDWQTTRYRTFTRVYIPRDSVLVNSSGIMNSSVVSAKDQEVKFPKSYFGGFISIEPKEEKSLIFEYYLPKEISDNIIKNNNYSLVLQKQSGSNIFEFKAEFNFLREIKDVKTEGDIEMKDKNKLYWKHDFKKDYNLDIAF